MPEIESEKSAEQRKQQEQGVETLTLKQSVTRLPSY